VTAELPAKLFLGRLLEHVAPRGFHVVRSGGLYAGRLPRKLEQARTALAASRSCSKLLRLRPLPPAFPLPPTQLPARSAGARSLSPRGSPRSRLPLEPGTGRCPH
jgi:hypothetical protein